ncbi:MAG TPA: hypothetical protein PKJ34_13375 [Anaerolineaceae bacterium]|nr:hypothetical protein [Anaerolineaceae bacterium]HOH21575.1 hypothetical protein [Anaerolineaceae bacterium]
MKRILCGFVFMSLLLAGCVTLIATNCTLKLSPGEIWNLKLELMIPDSDVALYGGEIAQSLSEREQYAGEENVEFTWETTGPNRDGNISYIITMKGKGFDLLSETLPFYINPNEVGRKKVLEFHSDMYSSAEGISQKTSFVLTGGKIISTNGTRVNSNTVRWDNHYDDMEAVMEYPKAGTPLPYLAALGAIGILILVIVLYARSRRKTSSYEDPGQPGSSYPGDPYGQPSGTFKKKFCTICGAKLKSRSGDCPHCGNPS